MNYRLRTATAEDLAAIARLEAACFDDPWSESAIASHLASPAGLAFLAVEEDGTVLGYILGLTLGEESELLRIGVLPEYRIKGVGWNLVDHFLFKLIPLGTKVCYLEVRKSNYAAQALYESNCFVETGTRKRYYKNPTEDAVIMAYRFGK